MVPQEFDVTIMCHNPTSQEDATSKEMSQDVSVFPTSRHVPGMLIADRDESDVTT